MKSIIYIAAILTFLNWSIAFSQNHSDKKSVIVSIDPTATTDSIKMVGHSTAVDSLKTKRDSINTAKTDTIRIDSVRIRFIPGMGQITDIIDSLNMFYRTQFLWSDSKYVGEMIWKLPGFFWRDLGETGKWGELNAFGLDGRYIGIQMDGRPMNDPITGTYNLYDLSLEFIDHIEMLSGSFSNISADGQSIAINFVTRSYNSYKPMTKLRFVQEPKGTLLTDGLYTQNVARGLNLMIGFQRQVTQGRYINAELDAWNIRTRLRYNISNKLNVALTDYYTKAGNGLNRGADEYRSASKEVSIFDEASASVVNESSLDSRSRHDLTLSAIARLFSDSSSTTQANIYYSTLDREYWDPADSRKIDDSTKSSFWGIHLRQQIPIRFLRVIVGGQLERRKSDSTRTLKYHVNTEKSAFMQAHLQLTDLFIPSISFRSVSFNGKNTLSSSVGFRSEIGNSLSIFADASWFDRFPTIQEQYWEDSTVIRQGEIQKEQHTFFLGGVDINIASYMKLSIKGYERRIKNAVVYLPAYTPYGSPGVRILNVSEVKIQGINGSILLGYHPFEFYGVMTLTRYRQTDTIKTLIPDIFLGGELSYHNKLFNEKLDIKIGARSCFYNRQQGMKFDPQMLSYSQYDGGILGRSTTLDLFVVLKIGDAHVSLSWNNVMDTGYIISPVYPMPGRQVRLGVNWVFME